MSGATLDAGALIGIDRNDRRVLALLERGDAADARITIPATALAQAIRDPQRQVRLMRLIGLDTTDIAALDHTDALVVGRMLAASRTADVTDAHVVLCARRAGQVIITSDSEDLRAIDPNATLITI